MSLPLTLRPAAHPAPTAPTINSKASLERDPELMKKLRSTAAKITELVGNNPEAYKKIENVNKASYRAAVEECASIANKPNYVNTLPHPEKVSQIITIMYETLNNVATQ